jgi:hypothetical protein
VDARLARLRAADDLSARPPVTYGHDAGGPFARIGDTLVHFSDHPTRDRAVMFGTCQGADFSAGAGAAVSGDERRRRRRPCSRLLDCSTGAQS